MSLAVAALAAAATALPLPSYQPNIVWIMADDMGVGELGDEHVGSAIKTPHLNAFAESGMRFSDSYAGYTVCAPSRATLFTGRNIGHMAGAPGPKGARWHVLPELLRSAGYETALFGKSAPMDDTQPYAELQWGTPLDFGFETFLGQDNQAYCHNMYPLYIKNGSIASGGAAKLNLPRNAKAKSRELCMAKPEDYDYTTDLFVDNALGWLRQRPNSNDNGNGQRPFFLYVSFTVPHAGGWGSEPEKPEEGAPVPKDMGYTNSSWPEVERDHAASVSYMDDRIGQLLATLDDAGVGNQTITFFASDNGPHNEGGHDVTFFGSQGGLRGYKRSFYEGGTRSPSLVRWPGTIPAMSWSDLPWAFWDVLPTMLELAHAPPADGSFDGRSIVPTLMGRAQPSPEYMYWTWRTQSNAFSSTDPEATREALAEARRAADGPPVVPGYGVRVDGWKGVVLSCADSTNLVPSDADAMQLYELKHDKAEEHDVADQHPDVVSRIKKLLQGKGLSCKCYQCGNAPQRLPAPA